MTLTIRLGHIIIDLIRTNRSCELAGNCQKMNFSQKTAQGLEATAQTNIQVRKRHILSKGDANYPLEFLNGFEIMWATILRKDGQPLLGNRMRFGSADSR